MTENCRKLFVGGNFKMNGDKKSLNNILDNLNNNINANTGIFNFNIVVFIKLLYLYILMYRLSDAMLQACNHKFKSCALNQPKGYIKHILTVQYPNWIKVSLGMCMKSTFAHRK